MEKGKLLCPKCDSIGFGLLQRWIRKKNNNMEWEYILYNSSKCCQLFCFFNRNNNCSIIEKIEKCLYCLNQKYEKCGNRCGKCFCIFLLILLLFFIIIIYSIFFFFIYLVFLIWFDLFYLCCGKKKTYSVLLVKDKITKEIQLKNSFMSADPFTDFDGLTIEEINKTIKLIEPCKNCKFQMKKLSEILPHEGKNSSHSSSQSSDQGIIAINLSNGTINFPKSCQKTDNFYEVEKSLLKKFPELRNKELYFLKNSEIIDKNKSIEENKIKDGDNILFQENSLTIIN